MLGATIGKSNGVATSGGITVAVFVGRESGLGVIILDSVSVFVYSWSIISWFMVSSWGMGWGMVSWGMYYWLVYNWGMINWSSVINWGSVVWTSLVDWNMGRGMDSSTVFFSSIWVMYVLWGSMGLA